VFVAEYVYDEEKPRTLQQFGPLGEVIATRQVIDRSISKCILDGSRVLEETTWLGKWLPMVPVLGQEVVVEEKRSLFSGVHFLLD